MSKPGFSCSGLHTTTQPLDRLKGSEEPEEGAIALLRPPGSEPLEGSEELLPLGRLQDDPANQVRGEHEQANK